MPNVVRSVGLGLWFKGMLGFNEDVGWREWYCGRGRGKEEGDGEAVVVVLIAGEERLS